MRQLPNTPAIAVCCRCPGLETIQIDICSLLSNGTDMTVAVALDVAGQGVTPTERVASMQAQLAALRITPDFLHSASWHLLQPSLTSLCVIFPGSHQAGPSSLADIVTSPLHLLQVPSLRSLEVDFATLPTAITEEQQALVSSLVHLTGLTGTADDPDGRPMGSFWSHAGSLPHLQSVTVWGVSGAADTFTIPASWSSCSSLTSLVMEPDSFSVANPAALLTLTSLQSLKLFCAPADLLHLRSLAKLTLLRVACGERDAPGQEQGDQQQPQPPEAQLQAPAAALAGAAAGAAGVAAAGAAGAAAAGAAAAAAAGGRWACSSTLVDLEWWDCLKHAPLQHLTGLSRLRLTGGEDPETATPLPDSLLAPLVGLSLLRVLELEGLHLTLDLCW
jgi:hypothetical protein